MHDKFFPLRFSRSRVLGSGCARLFWGVSLLGMGCTGVERMVEPAYDIRGRVVLVVPFRYGNFWHYQSKEGNRLGQSLEVALGANCGSFEAIRNRPIQKEIEGDLSDVVDWLDYGRRAGVKFLIVGEIERVRLENPKMVGMWQGQIRAKYEVWDIVAGQKGYSRTIEHRFPENPDSGQVFISFEQSKEEIETALLANTAKKIAGHLCGYEEEGAPFR